jgi:transposase InsO family protein
MPWKEVSAMSLRLEFVTLATADGANIRALCRRFGISSRTAYKWLARYRAAGAAGLADRSRRPATSPRQTPAAVEAAVVGVREEHPRWGGRKVRAVLLADGQAAPAASTVTAILRRRGLVGAAGAAGARPWQRFEHPAPNGLWQMDFKGHFPAGAGRCHPLTVLDDHSRFAVGIFACAHERGEAVQEHLTGVFRRLGLPDRLLCDNGPPWSGPRGEYTPLAVWLLRVGVGVVHGRPYHPQTQGKDERFHRTLEAEVLQGRTFADVAAAQAAFDAWRAVYNHRRPHEALGLAVPASRYRPSDRAFPERLADPVYGPGDAVRKVQSGGLVHFRGHGVRVGEAFRGLAVAVRPTATDGVWGVYFLTHAIGQVDLRGNHP